MSANGKVTTGFSYPYVAIYSNNDTTVTYSNCQPLARGVDVSIAPESSDDNIFYADNQAAESAPGEFTGGSVTLTVDGLLIEAERLIYGLPDADDDGFTHYGDDMEVPYCGVGYIARQQSAGVVTYCATILAKTMFKLKEDTAATQEDAIDWQTTSLEATIFRGDDENHNWKYVGADRATEAEAIADLTAKLGVTS